MNYCKTRRGFTLVEMIVVLALIAIIVAAIFVAIDPARRLQAGRNTRRWTDVRAILEATKQYQADNQGDWPSTAVAIDDDEATVQMIGEGGMGCGSLGDVCSGVTFPSSNCFASGLDNDLTSYLQEMPEDPKSGNSSITYYYINRDDEGFLVVGACKEEGEGKNGAGPAPEIRVVR